MTLTLTSGDLESYIIVNDSSTLTNSAIWFVAALCLFVDVWTYVRTYVCMDVCTDGRTFLPGLLGHLKRWPKREFNFGRSGPYLVVVCIAIFQHCSPTCFTDMSFDTLDLEKFCRVVFELCEQTDRQTDILSQYFTAVVRMTWMWP